MKKVILMIFGLVLLGSQMASAGIWCKWDGSIVTNCQDDNKGYIYNDTGFPVSTPAIANSYGYYKVTSTPPTLTDTQAADVEQWLLNGTTLERTWTVRDLTTDELDAQTAATGMVSREMYYVLSWLITPGAINTTTGSLDVSTAPRILKDAYLARGRLEDAQ